eukprot:134407_1
MSTYLFAIIVGTNGYFHRVDNTCEFGKTLDDYHSKSKTISCAAVGPNKYFAIICDDGTATYLGPKEFMSKIEEINVMDIKHISFGCNNQWVITMENGIGHGSLNKDSKCLDVINTNQGRIKYISLSDHPNAWIVGYGTNDYEVGSTLSLELTAFLSGIKSSKKTINLVEIGSQSTYFVEHENGFYWSLSKELSDWYKKESKEVTFSHISLYNQRDTNTPLSRNEILGNELADLETKYNAMSKEKETLQEELDKLKGNDIKTIGLNDLYERKHSMDDALGVVNDEIESRHKNTALCITCLNNEPKVLFQPCNHIVMCKDCTKKLKSNKCPICKGRVENTLDIYRASFQFH